MSPADRGLLHGTVDFLILRTLSREPMHGFAVSRDLRRRSEGVVELKDAALYQALHRLERKGLLQSEWGLSEKGKRAKFYEITARGRERLARDEEEWRAYATAVDRILAPGEG